MAKGQDGDREPGMAVHPCGSSTQAEAEYDRELEASMSYLDCLPPKQNLKRMATW